MWVLSEYENDICGKSIKLVDSKGKTVADSEPYYPHPLSMHHGLAIQDALNLVEGLASCDNTALDLAYFKGSARAILSNLEMRT